jgi:chromosome partitioning protein
VIDNLSVVTAVVPREASPRSGSPVADGAPVDLRRAEGQPGINDEIGIGDGLSKDPPLTGESSSDLRAASWTVGLGGSAERVTRVSRETSPSPRSTDGPAATSAERTASTSGTPVTAALWNRQTAAESADSAIDGSPDMHEVNDITERAAVRSTGHHVGAGGSPPKPTGSWFGSGSTPSASQPYDDDQQRQSLVGSLPLVDDSTPLAVQVAEDARRRISLVGRPFPAPPRTRILTVANQKGGVGKTTTTVNVAAAMAQAGLTVLVLDIDPQGNASTALGIDHHADIPSLYDVVVEGTPLADVMQPCPDVANLWCAPATIDLAGAEIELVSMVAREMRLQKALDAYLDERHERGLPQIDYIFVDCPPSLSLLTINAFVAATEVFIPIQCEYYALEGLSQLLKHIDLIRGHLNPRLHVSTILLTMYDGRTRLSAQVADEVRAHFSDVVVRTTVPRSVRISEAPSHSQTVMTYDPASSGALSYLEASRELAEQVLRWGHEVTLEEHA